MSYFEFLPTTTLYWRKTLGCCRELGPGETFRRAFRELGRTLSKSRDQLDISPLTEKMAIGAAPKSSAALQCLKDLGYRHIIDLRAERKESDILVSTEEVVATWIPTYDDWRAKSVEFFRSLSNEIAAVLGFEDKAGLLLCCGAGEHRAPLAGVLALVTMGYQVETATSKVQEARPVAEILPVYLSSLKEFLGQEVCSIEA